MVVFVSSKSAFGDDAASAVISSRHNLKIVAGIFGYGDIVRGLAKVSGVTVEAIFEISFGKALI